MLSLVTDRTDNDVTRIQRIISTKKELRTPEEQAELDSHASKGAYNYTDLNRVSEAMEYLVAQLNKYGYIVAGYSPVEISPGRYTWVENERIYPQHMEKYLANIKAVRNTLSVATSTPEVPASMRQLSPETANNIEKILLAVEQVIEQTVKAMSRSNAFTFWSGNRPFPCAESNLGRTWAEFDAMNFKWSDLDNANWYIWAYGDPRKV